MTAVLTSPASGATTPSPSSWSISSRSAWTPICLTWELTYAATCVRALPVEARAA